MDTKTINTQAHLISGLLFVLIAAFTFSTKAVLIKLAYGYGSQISPIMLMSLRMV